MFRLEKLKAIPDKPGVYLMKDEIEKIIYVGKASSLKNRLRSYFQNQKEFSARLKLLTEQISDFDYVVTDSEFEALILENNLIKKHRPYFNVRLRDDKTYPYIKITTNEEFPKLLVVRKILNDGAKYYGPHTSSHSMWETIKLIREVFCLRRCNFKFKKIEKRACLDYQLNLCSGPCIGKISQEDYLALVEKSCSFLEGKQEKILKELNQMMKKAADNLDYEKAAFFRDRIKAIEKIIEKQKIVHNKPLDEDIIGISLEEKEACLQILFIRQGKMIGQEYFFMQTQGAGKKEVLTNFVKQYYLKAGQIPKKILLSENVEEKELLQQLFSQRKKEKVILEIPRRGKNKELIELAHKNAHLHLKEFLITFKNKEEKEKKVLRELQNYLNLPKIPNRIEAYDISNIMGKQATGSLIVFKDGKPEKNEYRIFKIKTKDQPDDYAMLKEIINRRFTHSPYKNMNIVPDVILIDGGKGQLNCVLSVLKELNLSIPTISIAKKLEKIFLPDKDKEIVLSKDSSSLHLLQKIRDESHRFALKFHKKLRAKKMLS